MATLSSLSGTAADAHQGWEAPPGLTGHGRGPLSRVTEVADQRLWRWEYARSAKASH
ncbi:hypothetical protein GCM10023083_10210 [Streptomyces phyllanthi]